MAMHIPRAPGFGSMMKEGAKHISGLEEAVYRNIEMCKELSDTLRSAYGPYGQNKFIINHLDKIFVTNDACTILNELEVQHPAARLLLLASQQQEGECGDGTNMVIIFAAALLDHAQKLLRMGLSVAEVVEGYEGALAKAVEVLPSLVINTVSDVTDASQVTPVIRAAVMSKQYGLEDFLAPLITSTCISVFSTGHFNVDNIRICKILGQGVESSTSISGMVFRRVVEGDVRKKEDCRVAVFTCPFDAMQTETKGTVLIKTAADLMAYSKGEEAQIEEQVKSLKAAGVGVVVSGGKVGEMHLHFCNQLGLMVVRVPSKFDLRRLCRSISATPLPRVTAPTAEEAGHCDLVRVEEIGDTPVVVFKQTSQGSSVSTVLLRGATENMMDDIERAIDDGVNTFKALSRDGRCVAGAGACEIELAKQVSCHGDKVPGLSQYAIQKWAESLEELPRAIVTNAGVNASEVISQLYAAHQKDGTTIGVDIELDTAAVKDVNLSKVYDVMLTKMWALKFATRAACTVLNVDQIIMAKAAGGPKVKEPKGAEDDED